MNTVLNLGKYLFAIPMLMFGVGHMTNASAMAGMVPIPGGVFWIYLTGAALIAAAVSIAIGKMDKLATALLGLMLIIFALSIHLPGMMGSEGMEQQAFMASMMKDLALGGAAWFYATNSAKDNAFLG
ncbi:MAG: DoxX family protein [Cyanothece sp. SIO1E1]|nr:DoxX family protein [Cyanothece sp. SIO1E1]